LGLRSFQITASFPIILCPTLFCQSCAFFDRELLAPTYCKTRAAVLHSDGFCGLLEGFSRWRTFATHSAHFLARAFSDSRTLCIDIVIQPTFFEFFTLIGSEIFFADLLGYTAEAALCVSGGLHQPMLSGRFTWHIKGLL
jgi:hypothetical protein